MTLRITVDRVLKANAALGSTITVRYVFPPSYRGSRDAPKTRGLFFLHSTSAGMWELLPASLGNGSFELLFYPVRTLSAPVTYPYTARAPVMDMVLSELAESAEKSDGVEGFGDFRLSTIRYEDSPLVATIVNRFSQSGSVNLRALGLGPLIARGDTAALLRASKEVDVLAKSRFGTTLVSSFSGYRGTDPIAIRELGRIANY